MMTEIIWDAGFKRGYKKRISPYPILLKKFEDALNIFLINPFDSRLKTHKLSGDLKDCWSLSVDFDVRLIFKFISSNLVMLIDIGSHEEVY